jgi:4-alpha-glucanotransferase
LTSQEIERFGVGFDSERMAKPYIRKHLLSGLFGESTDEVIKEFLEETDAGQYRMKEKYDSQLKVNRHFP